MANRGENGREPPSQQLSTGLWLLKHTQGIVTTATAIGILHFRTCHVIYFTIGTLATSFTAKGLKRVIKQPRPPGSRVKKTSGMPSTHSASMSFMGTYILLTSLLLPLHPSITLASSRLLGEADTSEQMLRIWLALFSISTPLLVMWSRVRLGVHTPAQTIAGAGLGALKACLWFVAWNGTHRLLGSDLLPIGLKEKVGVPIDNLIAQIESKWLS